MFIEEEASIEYLTPCTVFPVKQIIPADKRPGSSWGGAHGDATTETDTEDKANSQSPSQHLLIT